MAVCRTYIILWQHCEPSVHTHLEPNTYYRNRHTCLPYYQPTYPAQTNYLLLNTRGVNKAREGSIKPDPSGETYIYRGQLLRTLDLPICSPWTFRENHRPNIIYTVNRRNQPTAMDLYFLDLVRTKHKTEPETHTKSAYTVL